MKVILNCFIFTFHVWTSVKIIVVNRSVSMLPIVAYCNVATIAAVFANNFRFVDFAQRYRINRAPSWAGISAVIVRVIFRLLIFKREKKKISSLNITYNSPLFVKFGKKCLCIRIASFSAWSATSSGSSSLKNLEKIITKRSTNGKISK